MTANVAPLPAADTKIRVMLVDDSPIIRGMNARILDKMPSVEIVASVSNGQMAVKRMEQGGIDVIVLDIEMPVMDGLTAIPLLLERDKNVKILMSSTLTQHGAEVSMRALQLGAADFIPKPTNIASVDGRNAIDDYRRDIVEKILALGDTVAKRKGRTPAAPVAQVKAIGKDPSTIYAGVRTAPKILALGSSTGGPQALMQVFRNLDAPLACPVLVTQHMPPHFTATLAKHIGDVAKMPSREAVDGEIVEPGRVYIAPGDYHMTVKSDGAKVRIALNQDPAENYCRPAVDPMFRSIADVYGKNALCVVLTGMGRDGAAGAKVAAEAGAVVVAQDEDTSVVWGMPGATYATGICDAVLPITEVAPFINKALKVTSHGAR